MSKTILVTGGSRGIGRACCIVAARRGWRAGINYAGNEAAAKETLAMVRDAGGQGIVLAGDVSNEADVIAMFAATVAAFGPLDGLVNNAGIVAPGMRLADMDVARMRRMFDVNILGAFLCAREAARLMARGGSIVNISSAAARLGGAGEYVDYAASKGAIDTMTIGLAKELGPAGIRVNAVRPGIIETDIHASGGKPDRAAQLGPTSPLGRAGTAEEVAEAVVWLLGDAASYATGALLDVAGGR